MVAISKYKDLWDNIPTNPEGNLLRRVESAHPLDLFIGFDKENRMMLVLFTDHLPRFPNSSKEIFVRTKFREDSVYVVSFSLIDERFKDVFITLTWDILNYTFTVSDKQKGLVRFLERFSMWQNLMAKEKLLGNEVKGLIGELLVLRDYCFPKFGVAASVKAWAGPLGADRDFEFDNSWIEVKTTSLSASQVQISSFEQMDTLIDGFLIICRLEKSSVLAPETISLHRLVSSIESILILETDALHLFRTIIQLTGYDDCEDSNMPIFSFHRFEKYRVDQDFPRIRRIDVSSEITGGSYQLNIPMIQNWREV